jgi:hypothetical protein
LDSPVNMLSGVKFSRCTLKVWNSFKAIINGTTSKRGRIFKLLLHLDISALLK